MTRIPRQTCLSSPRTFAPAGVSLLCACTEGLGALHRGSRRSRPRNNSDTCPHKHALSPRTLTSTTRQSFVRARTHPSDPLCLPGARVLPSSCRAWPCPAPCSTCLHEGSCCCSAWLVNNAASLQLPPPTMRRPRTAHGRFDDGDGRAACPVHVSGQCCACSTASLAVRWRCCAMHVQWCVGANSHHTWYEKERKKSRCVCVTVFVFCL